MQIYTHCIPGISQQHCETEQALVLILQMRKMEFQRLKELA